MIKPDVALKKLLEGNENFYKGNSTHPNLGSELRGKLVSRQTPYAAIIACSDSRVPVEIIFDAGIGDLFVIRSAGHVLSKETLGSIEYAVKNLNVKLVLILGHDNCGAVNTALSVYNDKVFDELSENLQALLEHINPVCESIDMKSPNVLDAAVRANIKYQVDDLVSKDEYIAQEARNGKILIAGAKYNLETGKVEVLYEHKSN